ncbi:MAG: hypothetical protein ABIS39_02875 [Sphingomicrobium sp.]
MQSLIEQHAHHSVLREQIVEHLLVGRLLQRLWSENNTSVEILRSEFDRGGYDLVADYGAVTRHIQLKCSRVGGTTYAQTLSLNLAKKPSGCVLWIVVDDDLEFQHFLWLGAEPGLPLPSLDDMKTARHVKGNSLGVRLERPNLRAVPKKHFRSLHGIDQVLDALFGPSWRQSVGNAAEI